MIMIRALAGSRASTQRTLAIAGLLAAVLILSGCSAGDAKGSLPAEAAGSTEAVRPAGGTTYRTKLYEQLGQPGPSLAFDEAQGALCEPGDPEARYTR